MSAVAVVSTAIFSGSLYLIFSEKLNRTITAICGAALMVGVGMLFGTYSEEQAIASIDFNTIGLLLGMMILVALLEPTGFIQYLAVWVGRWSRGRPLRLLVLLGSITTVLSMVLPNVTTVVLIAPVTILITELVGMSAIPLLVSEALLSNTGGVATLVGDPPNVLIASASGLTFPDFITHSLPIVVVAWITALLLLRYLFRAEIGRAAPASADAISNLNPAEALDDPKTARKILIVIGAAVVLFFVHHRLGLDPSFVALGCAAAALLWVRPDVHKTLAGIEWSVLIFFTALFVMVGGLETSGVLAAVARVLAHADFLPPVLFGVLLIWIVAGLSAVVDNVPITIALIPVIMGLRATGMPVTPLWWAVAFGAGFGGNGTLIGSTTNIVVASLSERTRSPITAAVWNKHGLPIMLATCAVTSVLYVVAYPFLSR